MRYYSSTAVEMALTGSVNELSTTIVVGTQPAQPAQTPFTLVLDVGLSTEEIVTVTEVSGTTLTVTRGEDGSTAVGHSGGAIARHMMTARDLREPAVHVAAAANVHSIGATASVVGTDTTQTLTNKTINFADNTTTAIPQASVTDLVDDIAALVLADAATAAHGATGSVVGTTNVQTLTNKTLSDPVVTGPPSNIHNPIGTLLAWAGFAEPPTGYLIADGAAVSRTAYSALYAVISTQYNIGGEAVTDFRLPNLQGRVIVGFDAATVEFYVTGQRGGEKTHVLSVAEMPAHTHGRSSDVPVGSQFSYFIGSGGSALGVGTGTNADSAPTTGSTGGGAAHNNLQPYIVLRYIIKY